MFRRLPVPSPQALEGLIQTISQRIGSYLEREGLLVRDIDNSYLQLEPRMNPPCWPGVRTGG